MLVKTLEKLFRYPYFADLLYPVRYEDGVYLLQDGGIGLIWELDGINTDDKSDEEMGKISMSFSNFLKNLPEEMSYQLIFLSSRGCESEELSPFTGGDLSNPYIRDYMERKIKWHDTGKKEGFARVGNIQFYPKTMKLFFTIKYRPPLAKGLHTDSTYKSALKKIHDAGIAVTTSLNAAGIKHRELQPDGLIRYMYSILNPQRAVEIPPSGYRGGDIRDHIVFSSPEANGKGWIIDGVQYNVISFATNPGLPYEGGFYTFPNMIFREVGGVSISDIIPSFLFTINFTIPNQESLRRNFDIKRTLSFIHRFNWFGDTSIDKEIGATESKAVLSEMYGGNKILKASYHLCFPSQIEQSDVLASEIVNTLNINCNCNAFAEDLIGNVIFTRSLPFGFDFKVPDEAKLVRRAVTATSDVIADLVPIYRSGRGVKTEVAIGSYNRRGEPVWLDLFDKSTAQTAPHCIVTGGTGAGKSVSVSDFFIHQALRQPANIIVIDKGESYKRPCLLYGGQYLKFEGEPEYIFDPMVGDFSDDHRAFLTAVISSMVTGGQEPITREEVSAISEAVLQLGRYPEEERNINNLVHVLRDQNDPQSVSIARRLFPFYGSGQYAKFVEGDKPKFTFSNRLTVFELGDVDAYRDLQAVLVFLLIYYTTEFVKRIEGRKYLIIDEAWSLFKNQVAVDFLLKAVKTFRKYGCAVIFVTQQLDDFAYIAEAMNMKDNCPNKILLTQELDVVRRNAEKLGLNQGTLNIYETIKKTGKYTEALIITQGWTAVSRITLDPESYWVTTSSEPDKVAINEVMRAKGMSLAEAIKYLSQKYPYGVPADVSVSMEQNKEKKRRYYD